MRADLMNGSSIKYIVAASGTQAAAGSSPAFDLGGYTAATVLAQVGTENSGVVFNVERSGTSNGSFAQNGASMSIGGSKLGVRRFTNQSSAIWHKVSWSGSFTGTVLLAAQGGYYTPIATQDDNVTLLSDVLV